MFSKPYLWVSHCFSWCSVWHGEERAKFIQEEKEKMYMYAFETESATEVDRQKYEDGKVETATQMQEKDGWIERLRGRKWDKQKKTDRKIDCIPWTQRWRHPPTFPTSASCHSWLMTAPILSLPPSPQSHKDLILSSHSELHIKPVHCYVCVCICVSWLGMWPLAEEKNVSVCKCLIVCLRFDKQAFLRKVCLTVGLSDKLPFWRKAYGLGSANKYTPRKSQLLTPGQRKLRSKGCIEYKSKSVMWYSSSYKHSQLSAWCEI